MFIPGIFGDFLPYLAGLGSRDLGGYEEDVTGPWYRVLVYMTMFSWAWAGLIGLFGATLSLAITGWPWGPRERRPHWRRRSAG